MRAFLRIRFVINEIIHFFGNQLQICYEIIFVFAMCDADDIGGRAKQKRTAGRSPASAITGQKTSAQPG